MNKKLNNILTYGTLTFLFGWVIVGKFVGGFVGIIMAYFFYKIFIESDEKKDL